MSSARIRAGAPFPDQRGGIAQLHGIGMLRVDDRFYAWGEDKRAGGTFAAVACYSSADLVEWRYEGDSLVVGQAGAPVDHADGLAHADTDLAPGRVIERPKVLRHPQSGQYVMFVHVDSADYADARVGFATSDDPVGPYAYHGSIRPLGHLSRDIGVFAEGDDAYLLSEDRERGLHIYRLRDDLLGVDELVATTRAEHGRYGYESPALVKADGVYLLFGSDLTGWAHNDNRYATAPALSGPRSPFRFLAPEGTATFDSQISTVLTIDGSERTAHIYIGDRWMPEALADSPPVWLPLAIAHGTAHLEWTPRWGVDVATGVVVTEPGT